MQVFALFQLLLLNDPNKYLTKDSFPREAVFLLQIEAVDNEFVFFNAVVIA